MFSLDGFWGPIAGDVIFFGSGNRAALELRSCLGPKTSVLIILHELTAVTVLK
jgi:hypothetical protein